MPNCITDVFVDSCFRIGMVRIVIATVLGSFDCSLNFGGKLPLLNSYVCHITSSRGMITVPAAEEFVQIVA